MSCNDLKKISMKREEHDDIGVSMKLCSESMCSVFQPHEWMEGEI